MILSVVREYPYMEYDSMTQEECEFMAMSMEECEQLAMIFYNLNHRQ